MISTSFIQIYKAMDVVLCFSLTTACRNLMEVFHYVLSLNAINYVQNHNGMLHSDYPANINIV